MKKLLLVMLTGILLASCSPYQRLQKIIRNHPDLIQSKIEVRDSIIEREKVVYKPVIVHDSIPGDTIIVEKEIPVPTDLNISPISAENKYSSAKAWVENSLLKLELLQKEQVITHILDSANKEITYWKEKYTNEKQTIVIKEKFTPKWVLWLAMYSLVLTIGLLLRVTIFKKGGWLKTLKNGLFRE